MTINVNKSLNNAGVCRLLGQLWASEQTLSAELLKDQYVAEIWETLGGLPPSTPDTMAEDFCRLFIGPKNHLPPMQSVWTDGELQSGILSDLNEFVAICGYHSPWPELLPDHIANQLQMQAVIIEKSDLEDAAGKTIAGRMQSDFINRHLSWTSVFLDRVQTADPDGFYGRLAMLTDSFLNRLRSD